jgi:hypothetical protein
LLLRISTGLHSLRNGELLCGLWCLFIWRMHHLFTDGWLL